MHTLSQIKLLQKQRLLILDFADGKHFELPCHYLRKSSPSAEMRGHGNEPKPTVNIKEDVNIIGIDPVGNYAVKLIFDDGHQTGIYSFDYLYKLGEKFPKL